MVQWGLGLKTLGLGLKIRKLRSIKGMRDEG